jgi:hypothetical protein
MMWKWNVRTRVRVAITLPCAGRGSTEAKTTHDQTLGFWARLSPPLPPEGGYDNVLAWKSSLKSTRIRSMEALLLPLSVMELRLKQTPLPICVRWLKMLSNAISTMQNKCQRLFACISSVTKCCRYEAAARSRRKPADQSAESARLFHRPPADLRIVTQLNGQHHETIPNHSPIKVGTLARILQNIARHHNVTVEDLLSQLDL